jgi:heptosyltransferase-3
MNRILLIHRGSLGDFLLLSPSLALLKKAVADCHIEALGRPEILSLVSPRIIEAVELVERSIYLPLFEHAGELHLEAVGFIQRFDAALAFVKDSEGVLKQNLRKFGVSKILVCPPFPPENNRVHVASYSLEQVVSFLRRDWACPPLPDVASDHINDVFLFTEEESQWAAGILKRNFCQAAKPLAIHCGSGSEGKCWPFERFEALARKLSAEGRRIIFVLGPADERLKERVHQLAGQLNAPVADSLPLRRLAAVLCRSGAYIGNDSGVSHLAALTGIPTMVIFGPTDPEIWKPIGPNVRVVSGSVDCSPCNHSKMLSCNRRICLDSVSVQTVLEEVHRSTAPKTPKNIIS